MELAYEVGRVKCTMHTIGNRGVEHGVSRKGKSPISWCRRKDHAIQRNPQPRPKLAPLGFASGALLPSQYSISNWIDKSRLIK